MSLRYKMHGDDDMFLIAGVAQKQQKLDFDQTIICTTCGRYGRYEVFMEFMSLSLFFIPILKWSKVFYVRSSCCGSLYSISKELGQRIARGEAVTITEQDLQWMEGSIYHVRQCPNCHFKTNEDYQFCPKCSTRLD